MIEELFAQWTEAYDRAMRIGIEHRDLAEAGAYREFGAARDTALLVYAALQQANTDHDRLGTELNALLDGRVYALPDGRYLVPVSDEWDSTVEVREAYRPDAAARQQEPTP
jgi:hypothetical protein